MKFNFALQHAAALYEMAASEDFNSRIFFRLFLSFFIFSSLNLQPIQNLTSFSL
jgi:hypothetical protein